MTLIKHRLETCFSPSLFEAERYAESIVVVLDVLRASSAICTAFACGAAAIRPVTDIETARKYKDEGFLIAAERDGIVLGFADFGNSPFNFTRDKVEGKTIVYSTTNGTAIINMASSAYGVAIGSFLNIGTLSDWLVRQERDILLFCAGWKNRFNIEDTVCAGAFALRLINSGKYSTVCDSTIAAMDLWELASHDLRGYIEKAAQRNRLREKNLDDCIDFCLTMDYTDKIPVLDDGILVNNIL